MSEMPEEIWAYKTKGSNHRHYSECEVFADECHCKVVARYIRADLESHPPAADKLVAALRSVTAWLECEIFDDDDRTGGATQEERAENISQVINEALAEFEKGGST